MMHSLEKSRLCSLEKSRLRRFFRTVASLTAAKGVAFAACVVAWLRPKSASLRCWAHKLA
jgi:hypothetical protein